MLLPVHAVPGYDAYMSAAAIPCYSEKLRAPMRIPRWVVLSVEMFRFQCRVSNPASFPPSLL